MPNSEKLFSIFEPETQLFKRGKAGEPVQFGHPALVVEDAAGFICDYKLWDDRHATQRRIRRKSSH